MHGNATSADNATSTISTSTSPPPAQSNWASIATNKPSSAVSALSTAAAALTLKKNYPVSISLSNLGNSCYLNCIVQCLAHDEPLTHYLLGSKATATATANQQSLQRGNSHGQEGQHQQYVSSFDKDLNKSNPLRSGGQVAQAYASPNQVIWSGQYTCTKVEFQMHHFQICSAV